MYRDNRGRRVAMRPIVQMVGDPEEFRTESGIPCGNLSGYTAMVQKRLIQWMYAVPYMTGKIKDAKARYYVALRFSIARNVSQFMAANPSTLVQFARTLDAEKESLLRDLHDGTLRTDLDIPTEVRAWLTQQTVEGPGAGDGTRRAAPTKPDGSIPRKSGRSRERSSTPGPAAAWVRTSANCRSTYGRPPIRDLGLLASEGRMTIPLEGNTASGVLDIWSHYFEFVPEGEIDSPQPTVLGAHELSEGKSYFIVPTTAYGLYRYHISDLVRVTGFYEKTPLVEFLGKGHRFANLTGEKLSEYHVTQAMDAVAQRVPQAIAAYSLAPVWDETRPYYGLFLEETDAADESALRRFLVEFDRQLGAENVEYSAKRESGRLGSVRARLIPAGAWSTWDRARLAATGGSPEQYKHPCLIGDIAFRDTMQVLRELE